MRDLKEGESSVCVPALVVAAELDRWLKSLFAQRICYELYATVTGIPMGDLLLYQRPVDPVLLKRRLVEAFRNRELVALPISPLRLRRSGKSGGSSTSSAAPLPVPLLPDAGEKKNKVEAKKKSEENNKEKKKEPAWVAVKLVDEDGKPIGGTRYRVLLPNGQVRDGKLDSQGHARLEGLTEGSYKISFPDFDSKAWKAGA
jgi:hypothetical protein